MHSDKFTFVHGTNKSLSLIILRYSNVHTNCAQPVWMAHIYICMQRARAMHADEWMSALTILIIPAAFCLYTFFCFFFFGFVYLFSSGVACLICAFRQQNTFRIYTTIMSELMLLRWRQPKIHIWIYFLISMMNLITMLRWIEMMHSTQLQRKDSINTIK